MLFGIVVVTCVELPTLHNIALLIYSFYTYIQCHSNLFLINNNNNNNNNTVALWTVSGQELFLVVARSEFAALRRGMLCRQNSVLLLCVLTLSANN